MYICNQMYENFISIESIDYVLNVPFYIFFFN